MADIPRLNGVVKQLAAGKPVFLPFMTPNPENAVTMASTDYDGVVWEMEHSIYDIRALRDTLQYMLSRQQIVDGGTLAPKVTSFVRIPVNGIEHASWVAKQVLDIGIYGIIWPHVGSVDEAMSCVSACRYPKRQEHPLYKPFGVRGDAPTTAARYWGISNQDYYKRADVWPLLPEGEVMCVLQIEELRAIKALPKMLSEVPGIGCILIGEGDLSQEMGIPRQYDNPTLRSAMSEIIGICKEHKVAVGHPHVDADNVERVLSEGYTWLMPSPVTSHPGLVKGKQLSGRA